MSVTHFYTATSLDGFLATDDHSLDWLMSRDFDPDGPMAYPGFLERIGSIIMGASTYEWILRHEETWEYVQPTWVFTHRDLAVAPGSNMSLVQGEVTPVHRSRSGESNHCFRGHWTSSSLT